MAVKTRLKRELSGECARANDRSPVTQIRADTLPCFLFYFFTGLVCLHKSIPGKFECCITPRDKVAVDLIAANVMA
jgi:hypothetical protein